MKPKFFLAAILVLTAISVDAQRRRRGNNSNDTISSNYQPAELFSPLYYNEKGSPTHAANGEPGPKNRQKRKKKNNKTKQKTTTKTKTTTKQETNTNNS